MYTRGFSLNIGLNRIDPTHYLGWNGALRGCENDARALHGIATNFGYESPTLLLNEAATSTALLGELQRLSQELGAGDFLLLTYSGHGSSLPDLNGDEVKLVAGDKMDEVWCLYDRMLLDDELYRAFQAFRASVHILVLLDSCHSGTAIRGMNPGAERGIGAGELTDEQRRDFLVEKVATALLEKREREADAPFRSKLAPDSLTDAVYLAHQGLYDPIGLQPAAPSDRVQASIKLISACQDDQEARDGAVHGYFTQQLLRVMAAAQAPVSYGALHQLLVQASDFTQKPNFLNEGRRDPAFDEARPFVLRAGQEVFFTADTPTHPAGSQPASNRELIVELRDGTPDAWPQTTATPRGATLHRKPSPLGRKKGAKATDGLPPALLVESDAPVANAWDLAYETYQTDRESVGFVEPNLRQPIVLRQPPLAPRGEGAVEDAYMNEWHQPPAGYPDEFIWHLDAAHSGLDPARNLVMETNPDAHVRIAHVDTGYLPGHPGLPEKLRKDLAKSLISGEEDNPGEDLWDNAGGTEQDGHGSATSAILAGGRVKKTDSYGNYEGWLGGAPFAEVVPVRISDTVVKIFNANVLADAIEYAVERGCEVVTISMAGRPTRRWAKAVNFAYERGVTIVAASGNNWVKSLQKLLPDVVLYPARFERVIAATGVCFNQLPYDFEANPVPVGTRSAGGETMQGNWGPSAAMHYALAAYTPNLVWVTQKTDAHPFNFSRTGGGTSSATPQVAAAAALYIAHHRQELADKGYAGTWKQVEAVRHALFSSAEKDPFWEHYFGNGILKARRALDVPVASEDQLEAAPEARASLFGLSELVRLFTENQSRAVGFTPAPPDPVLTDMAALEIRQLLYTDPDLHVFVEQHDLEAKLSAPVVPAPDAAWVLQLKAKLAASPYASTYLKGLLG